MRSFTELLREYIARTGVSDAELARAVGVQRQTVFRWKEGLVARPRSAEDVLRLAAKLRLTPEERDELLLAAGFPPVVPPQPATGSPHVPRQPVPEEHGEPATIDPSPAPRQADLDVALPGPGPSDDAPSKLGGPRWRTVALVGALALLATIVAVVVFLHQQARYPQASQVETLIVIAQFGNYTGGAQGYNVAGRLSEALELELAAAGLKDARAAVWPAAVTDAPAAARALERSGAALLIWGEYDSGRVVARFLPQNNLVAASRELSLLAATPADLPAVINTALPGDIRYLALYCLAQVYVDEGQPAPARAVLGQAGLNLPADPGTRAAHYFLWGYANQIAQPPDVNAAIEGYTEALKLNDGLDAAHNNRAVAYLRRRGAGDLAGAVEDLTHYLAKQSDDPAAYNNRGSAYFLLGGSDNLSRALEDLDRAVALAPEDATGYYNRGLVYVRLDEGTKWRADFQRALKGGHAGAQSGLCWGLALSEEPATAIEHCRQAVEAGGDVSAWENLGAAYARTGQYDEAVAALRKYRDALGATNAGLASSEVTRIDRWLAALNAGKDPFDAETLRLLREE